MRTLNISLIATIGAFALLLTLIALPTLGERPLSHWAMSVGALASASAISLIYIIISLMPKIDHKRSHSAVLYTYIPCLIISVITGSSWGLVGHAMETEKMNFETAFWYAENFIYGGYLFTATIFSITLIYLIKQRKAQCE